MKLNTCPACGFKSLPNSSGSYEECAKCGWIDDIEQLIDPTNKYGANNISLAQYQNEIELKDNLDFEFDEAWLPFDTKMQKEAFDLYRWWDCKNQEIRYWKRDGISKALPFLNEFEKSIIFRAQKAVAFGNYIPDCEFELLIGGTKKELKDLIKNWDVLESKYFMFSLMVNNSLNNLLYYPHGKDEELTNELGVSKKELSEIFDKWYRLKFPNK
ncbi:CPCC family cysteine-rich protein [Aliikangiella sp. IMCC44359]|uniref:CPCC family cysteine-rich protein n=1 Tax=Aliikangiella sp. IMCC44359 TaxID=3459125 RepID=UPI00403B1DC9